MVPGQAMCCVGRSRGPGRTVAELHAATCAPGGPGLPVPVASGSLLGLCHRARTAFLTSLPAG